MSESKIFFGGNVGTQGNSGLLIEEKGDQVSVFWKGDIDYANGLNQKYGLIDGSVEIGNDAHYLHPEMLVEAQSLLFHKMLSEIGPTAFALITAGKICGQQHGTTWIGHQGVNIIKNLHDMNGAEAHVAIQHGLVLPFSPMWKNKATKKQCAEMRKITEDFNWVRETGAVPVERFPAAQTKRLQFLYPKLYERTAHICWLHSFITSLLTQRIAPVGWGDGLAANLADIHTKKWLDDERLNALAPELKSRLPELVHPDTYVGLIGQYWQDRFPFGERCAWYASDGDNNGSLPGAGCVKPGQVVLSLGTSFTLLRLLQEATYDPKMFGILMAAITGDYMGMLCFSNGGLCFDQVRKDLGIEWPEFDRLVAVTHHGNRDKRMKPFLVPELVPNVEADWRHIGMGANDEGAPLAVVQALFANMINHAGFMGEFSSIIGTGSGATNPVLQIAADMFGVLTYPGEQDTVALGAAMGARHAFHKGDDRDDATWSAMSEQLCTLGKVIKPRPKHRKFYDEFIKSFATI